MESMRLAEVGELSVNNIPIIRSGDLVVKTLVMVAVIALCGQVWATENGLKVGNGRLHPSVKLESRYDSQAASVPDDKNGGSKTVGDMILKFGPGINLELPSPAIALSLGANLEYLFYSDIRDEGTRDYSDYNADADLDLAINNEGQVSANIGDQIVFSDDLTNTPALEEGAKKLFNDARFKLSLRPSVGSLYIEPEYHLITENFEKPEGGEAEILDEHESITHNVQLNGRWKFLPKTALTVNSTFAARSYPQANRSKDINTIKGTVGLSGLITKHVFTVLKLGWGQDLTEKSYSSPIGQAEIGYMLSDTASVRGGYMRSFDPSGSPYITYGTDRAYIDGRIQVLPSKKLDLHAVGSVDFIDFNGYVGSNSEAERDRKDRTIGAEFGADYLLTAWSTLSGGYVYSYRKNNVDGDEALADGDYTRHEAYLRVKLVY